MDDRDEQMMSAPAEAYRERNPKRPKHNKLKLVYGKDSYFYVEPSEAQRIIRIQKYLQRHPKAYLKDLSKALKTDRATIIKTLRALAGAKAVYMRNENGQEVKLCGPVIKLRKEMFNPIRNKPHTPQFLKADIVVSRAGA